MCSSGGREIVGSNPAIPTIRTLLNTRRVLYYLTNTIVYIPINPMFSYSRQERELPLPYNHTWIQPEIRSFA